MISINANDLKKEGISVMSGEKEALITVRGKPAYVILSVDKYEHMNEVNSH